MQFIAEKQLVADCDLCPYNVDLNP